MNKSMNNIITELIKLQKFISAYNLIIATTFLITE